LLQAMAKTCQAVSCDSASLSSCLAGLSTGEASAEVGQLLRCLGRSPSPHGHERFWPVPMTTVLVVVHTG